MNVTLRARLLPAALGMLFICAPAPVSAAQYTFTNIADNSTIASFGTLLTFGLPAVSGNTVAFQAYSLKGGRLQRGILTGSGGPLTTIAANTDDALFGKGTFFGDPAISGNSVAFVEYGEDSRHGGSGLFIGSGGTLTTIGKSFDAAPSDTFQGGFHDISISGNTVAFISGYSDKESIITSSEGHLKVIASLGDPAPIGSFTELRDPSISGNTVVFNGDYADGPDFGAAQGSGVFTGSGGVLTTVVKTGDAAPVGVFTAVANPTIAGGTVPFLSRYDTQYAILSQDAGGLRTIVKVGDPAPYGEFRDFDSPSTSMNEAAFFGYMLPPGEDPLNVPSRIGIFVGNGGPIATVIKTGDPLFGSTIAFLNTSIRFDRFGLAPDGGGNLTFEYELADGRYGIALARPVPEPSSLAILLAAACGLVCAKSCDDHLKRDGKLFLNRQQERKRWEGKKWQVPFLGRTN